MAGIMKITLQSIPPSVKEGLLKVPKPQGKHFAYGTAGFRDKADILDSVFYRMGLLATLRARVTGKAVGMMITASHNPVQDNGIKLVDPDGGMLAQSWESHATALANADTEDAVLLVIANVIEEEKVPMVNLPKEAVVIIARDTRPSSLHLATLALDAIAAIGGASQDLGILTTPQLHHVVQHHNSPVPSEAALASEEGYYTKLAQSFVELLATASPPATVESKVIVDCAFGVGGAKLPLMAAVLEKERAGVIAVDVRNAGGAGEEEKLNYMVGAEHVQKQREAPLNTVDPQSEANVRCASFDGDADRIVYWYYDSEGQLKLIDGDKIAALLGGYIQSQFALLPAEVSANIKVGVVQTAYANGAAMRYAAEGMKVDAPLVKTGVKYLHHKALDYDIGVYFEANGHGTVLFKPAVIDTLVDAIEKEKFEGQSLVAARRLVLLGRLLNQATGDAISDLLACEAVLALRGITVQDWDKLYEELPSRQLKVKVADRTKIVTTADESRCTGPVALQPALDKLVGEYAQGRAFVRPSGTEDVVRIYAEATTQPLANELALKVAQAAFDNAGGVGDRP